MSPAYLRLWAVFWHPRHLWLWQSFLPLFQGLPWAPPNIWCGSLDLLPPASRGSPSDEEMSLLLNGSRAPTSLTVLNYFASWFRECEGLCTWFFEFEYERALVPRDLPFLFVLQTALVTCQAVFFPQILWHTQFVFLLGLCFPHQYLVYYDHISLMMRHTLRWWAMLLGACFSLC